MMQAGIPAMSLSTALLKISGFYLFAVFVVRRIPCMFWRMFRKINGVIDIIGECTAEVSTKS